MKEILPEIYLEATINQRPHAETKPVVFHVKYQSCKSVLYDIGQNPLKHFGELGDEPLYFHPVKCA